MEKCYYNRVQCLRRGKSKQISPFSTDSFLKQMAKKRDSVLSGSTLSAYKVL